MDILKLFQDKVSELGSEEVRKLLDVPKQIFPQFVNGKKKPGLETCQKIIDLWGDKGSCDAVMGDGSIMDYSVDENGILNGSYCPPEWGRKKAAWDGRDVCLCLPTNKPIPEVTHFSQLALVMRYRMALRLEWRGQDSMITRSRNQLAKRFLDTGATWSMWFDSDMVFPMGHAGVYMTLTNMRHVPEKFLGFHVIERLLSWNKSFVGGCYWDRRGGGKLIAGGGNIVTSIPSDSIQPIGFVGTGCVLVNRQVFLDIATMFPETMSPETMGNETGFFTNIQTPQRMLGEDESFALRAAKAGHTTFLDLGLLCGHVGTENVHAMPVSGSKI